MLAHAQLRLLANVGHGIRIGGLALVGDQQAGNVEVEVVVGKDHAVVGAAALLWAVDVAVEEVVLCRAEGRLDVVVELGDDVGDFGEVGVVVWGCTSVCLFLCPFLFGDVLSKRKREAYP